MGYCEKLIIKLIFLEIRMCWSACTFVGGKKYGKMTCAQPSVLSIELTVFVVRAAAGLSPLAGMLAFTSIIAVRVNLSYGSTFQILFSLFYILSCQQSISRLSIRSQSPCFIFLQML